MSLERNLHRCRDCGKPFRRTSQARACEADHERQREVPR